MNRSKTLPVMEVYYACQGEGILIGQPSMFIRLFGCNLRCSWCDTAYSINRKEWKASGEEGEPYERKPIAELIDEVQLAWTTNIIITGGEPTIHKGLVPFVQALTAMHRNVTIETNGTIIPEGLKEWKLGVLDTRPLWSISPKSATSSSAYPTGYSWMNIKTLNWYVRSVRCQLKFVCQSQTDLRGVHRVLACLDFEPSQVPIIIQPEGTLIKEGVFDYLQWLKTLQTLVEEDTRWERYDVRVLPQLHTMIHGQERFV